MRPHVVSVSAGPGHNFSKPVQPSITLLAGLGVAGDAHAGASVKHRSRVAKDPTAPNLRQVHLIHAELLDELADKGFVIQPGDMGENILTRGVDLLALPRGARLNIGEAVIEITGLRNPCAQLDNFQPGLMQAVLARAPDGGLIRKAGVMGVVICGGAIKTGDSITAHLPPKPHSRLEPV